MKVIYLQGEQQPFFVCVPRKYPTVIDSIKLVLRDENSKAILTPDISSSVQEKLRIELKNVPDGLTSGSKYEITVMEEDEIIYLGKLLALNDPNTDIQNYKHEGKDDDKFRFRE